MQKVRRRKGVIGGQIIVENIDGLKKESESDPF